MDSLFHTRFAWLGCLICLSLVIGCSKPQETVKSVPPVTLFTLPEPGETPFRTFPGDVSAARNSRLSFDVSGRLTEFPVYDGKIVQQGELIGRLEASDFRSALDSAQARFTSAQREFERARSLRDRRVIAQQEFDLQEKNFQVADAALRTARKAFEDTQLFAPFKGRVSQRFVRNFQNVRAQEPVVLLQDVSTLEIDVQIPERVMALTQRNTTAGDARDLVEAFAEFAAIPGEKFPLALKSFATRADPASRTFLVSFEFRPPEDRNLLPGMTSTVFLRFREESGPAAGDTFEIPLRALRTSDGQTSVWKWNASTSAVAAVPVEILELTGESIRISAPGLKPGEQIVASGVRFLTEGDQVRPLETRQP